MKPEIAASRSVRLMFQDEARFGRMVRPKRCWAPHPFRPVLRNGYEREFVYVYGAVSPIEGEMDWCLCREMNTLRMGEFLTQVSQAHPNEFIVMVVDGASSHRAKDLVVPENIRLLALPPYAPELNPAEYIWNRADFALSNSVSNSQSHLRSRLHRITRRLRTSPKRLWACIHASRLPWKR